MHIRRDHQNKEVDYVQYFIYADLIRLLLLSLLLIRTSDSRLVILNDIVYSTYESKMLWLGKYE